MDGAFEMWRFLSTVAFTTHIAPTVVCEEINETFISHVINYYSYFFPLRDDATSFAFRKDEFAENQLIYMDVDLDKTAEYIMSNPAWRKTEYNEKILNNDTLYDYMGIRFIQLYIQFGFPIEVPCFSSSSLQNGLTTSFHILPERDFISNHAHDIFHLRREGFFAYSDEKPYQVPYLAAVIKTIVQGPAKFHLVGRAAGSHTYRELQHILEDDHGRLQMNSNYLLGQGSREEVENLTIGISLVCAQNVDNEPRSTGFVVNIDAVYHPQKPWFTYDQLLIWTEERKNIILPFSDEKTNMKLDVSWNDWSCCSACCCSSESCGRYYTSQRKCSILYSYRVRMGYLSVMKIRPELSQTKDMTEWDRIMMVTPYREKGIPIFSTMWRTNKRLKDIYKIVEELYIRYKGGEKMRKKSFHTEAEVFIDEMSCANDPQKSDCSLLASCRGINIEPPNNDNKENYEYDPCEGNDVLIFTIEKRKQALKVEPDKNYRIVIKEGAFDTNTEEIRWRVSLHDVNPFDPTKSCLEQGIVVHPNRKDLMLMKLSKRDLRKRIEATLKDGTKVAAQLEHRTKGGTVKHQPHIIIWGLVVLAFLASLVSFIIVIHRTRVQRITIVVKNKGRKDYMETSNVL